MKKGLIHEFKNESKPKQHILTLSGVVAEKGFFSETINAKDIKEALDDVTKDIVIRLNSGGGDVFQGVEIFNYLQSHKSHITIEITALAASAASLIAMAADKIVIRTGASIMLHEASTFTFGNKSEHQKSLNALSTIDNGIVDIYAERTKIDKTELANMIEAETWLSADEAVKQGFADEKTSKKAIDEPSDRKKGGEKEMSNRSEELAKVIARFLNEELPNDDPSEEEPNETDEDSIIEKLDKLDEKVTDIGERVAKLEGKEEEKPPQNSGGYGRFLF